MYIRIAETQAHFPGNPRDSVSRENVCLVGQVKLIIQLSFRTLEDSPCRVQLRTRVGYFLWAETYLGLLQTHDPFGEI